jgi:Asp/Glu/hydantoin racemase
VRIALVHATLVAVEPIREAFQRAWPEVETVNLLDDSLPADRAATAELTGLISERIMRLATYGYDIGSHAVLFTCSAFGPAIEAAARALPIPVLKPNEAMFEDALRQGERIGMIATFGPAVATMEAEFRDEAQRLNPAARLRTELVEDAMTALRAGDAETHNRLVAERAARLGDCQAIVLAHFSTARAAEAVRQAVRQPVLTSPDAAVARLKRLLAREAA